MNEFKRFLNLTVIPKQKPYRAIGAVAGAILGLGAPAGYFVICSVAHSGFSGHRLTHEISESWLIYGYLSFLPPLVFLLFGYEFGRLLEKTGKQRDLLEQANIILQNQSMTDDLTGLFNHRQILSEIDKEVERARRYKRQLSGMMVDMDDFKSVNDRYGHRTGDSVLREVAEIVRCSVRNVDIVGRFGGDEFLVILPEASREAAGSVAERVLNGIRQHSFKTGRDYIELTVSVGVFSIEDPKDFEKTIFLDKIDRAMFRSKEEGKNRIYFA